MIASCTRWVLESPSSLTNGTERHAAAPDPAETFPRIQRGENGKEPLEFGHATRGRSVVAVPIKNLGKDFFEERPDGYDGEDDELESLLQKNCKPRK